MTLLGFEGGDVIVAAPFIYDSSKMTKTALPFFHLGEEFEKSATKTSNVLRANPLNQWEGPTLNQHFDIIRKIHSTKSILSL